MQAAIVERLIQFLGDGDLPNFSKVYEILQARTVYRPVMVKLRQQGWEVTDASSVTGSSCVTLMIYRDGVRATIWLSLIGPYARISVQPGRFSRDSHGSGEPWLVVQDDGREAGGAEEAVETVIQEGFVILSEEALAEPVRLWPRREETNSLYGYLFSDDPDWYIDEDEDEE